MARLAAAFAFEHVVFQCIPSGTSSTGLSVPCAVEEFRPFCRPAPSPGRPTPAPQSHVRARTQSRLAEQTRQARDVDGPAAPPRQAVGPLSCRAIVERPPAAHDDNRPVLSHPAKRKPRRDVDDELGEMGGGAWAVWGLGIGGFLSPPSLVFLSVQAGAFVESPIQC
jgi:hypothetical protein